MAYRNDFESMDPFSMYFNMMKIKYVDLDNILSNINNIYVGDNVNVFINLESIFKYLTIMKDLEQKITICNDFYEIIISNLLNIAAHYRRFFINNRCSTKVFLYYSDFNSTKYHQDLYVPEYRSYYTIKYSVNPKFIKFTECFTDKILPDTKEILSHVNGVYIMNSHNIESGVIPYIISKEYADSKNIIIGAELYETQYSLIDNFINLCVIKSKDGPLKWLSSADECLHKMFLKEENADEMVSILTSSYESYCALLAIMKDKYRSVDGVKGIGPVTLYKSLKQRNINKSNPIDFNKDTDLFYDKDAEELFRSNYKAISVMEGYSMLSKSDIKTILDQMIDRFDNNDLMYLNRERFFNHQIMLQELTCSGNRGN